MSLDLENNIKKLNELAVENFREYLRIPTVHPSIDYSKYIIIKYYI